MHGTRPAFKLWLETDDGCVFGPGVYSLLKKINETGTLKEAAESLEMSYRYSWGLIKKAEEKLGEPLIAASKGGRLGGGSTEITELGARFIEDFERIRQVIQDASIEISGIGEITGTIEQVSKKGEEYSVVVKPDSEKITLVLNKDSADLVKGAKVRLSLRLASGSE
ncbi:MAG: LysR family transcriptional regulator [Candidatus Bathyarchaeota archaeon]|nr:LysR family transcriptional regulator [Candidatus Bathyarchaeota archaeon]